jgi:hypothetical protein
MDGSSASGLHVIGVKNPVERPAAACEGTRAHKGVVVLFMFFLKGTVGQSPPATKYINKRGRTNRLTKYLKGGKRTPNQQLGRGGANRTNYTSGKGSSPKKKGRRKTEKSWRASSQTQEESAILESLKPS